MMEQYYCAALRHPKCEMGHSLFDSEAFIAASITSHIQDNSSLLILLRDGQGTLTTTSLTSNSLRSMLIIISYQSKLQTR
jgi:hypothetical protein